MKTVGIVGVELKKLDGRVLAAKRAIMKIVEDEKPTAISSGACHLGGIDDFAERAATYYGLEKTIFEPKTLSWSNGYKPRNLQIAEASDVVYCITVKTLPASYDGMRFKLCYHCGTSDHIKSGGCWTVKQAKKLGKRGVIIVLD